MVSAARVHYSQKGSGSMFFKKALEKIFNKEYQVTDKERIKQNEQLELKNELTDALLQDLEANDIQAYRIQKGLVVLIENYHEGAIPVEIQIITKPLNYDYDALHAEYLEKIKAKN